MVSSFCSKDEFGQNNYFFKLFKKNKNTFILLLSSPSSLFSLSTTSSFVLSFITFILELFSPVSSRCISLRCLSGRAISAFLSLTFSNSVTGLVSGGFGRGFTGLSRLLALSICALSVMPALLFPASLPALRRQDQFRWYYNTFTAANNLLSVNC